MTIVIKVGTKALTGAEGTLNKKVLQHLGRQIAELRKKRHRVLLVSSGAMGAGRAALGVKQKKDESLPDQQLFAAVGQPLLMEHYRQALKDFDITPAQFLVIYDDFTSRGHYLNLRNAVERTLSRKYLPIFNENDAVATQELKFGDNDRLSVLIAGMMDADALVLLTDTDGLWATDPATGACTRLVGTIAGDDASWKRLCTPTSNGRGGMMSKVATAQLAARLGIAAYIGKAETANLARLGEKWPGTRVEPVKRAASIQRWLATNPLSEGAVIIDDGAARALRAHKSLLAVGVKETEGTFRSGDLIDVKTTAGGIVAKGVVKYASRSLRRLLESGNRRGVKEVIHCDKMILL